MQLSWRSSGPGLFTGRRAAHGRLLRHVNCQMRAVENKQATLTSIKDLPSQYKGVLLDQFGVLHDGKTAYPGAVQAVEYLHGQGVALLIISNSSRRVGEALSNLGKLGFTPAHFAGVVTSGEATHRQLQQRPTPFWEGLGHRCLHFTWAARGAISLGGLNLEVTQDPAAADFILAHGTEALGAPALPSDTAAPPATPCSLAEMEALMQQCAERARSEGRSIPMIVANPDVVTVHGTELRTMPGTLARMYRQMGGEVHLMGKPAPIIYEAALAELGLPASQVLAIGDSLEHDIAGAAAAGVDSLFVVGGIHAQELELGCASEGGEGDGRGYSRPQLEQLCASYGATPTHVLPYFDLQ